MEHGHLSYKDVLEHARAARGSTTTVITRIPRLAEDHIKRVLDIGVDGFIVPMVRTAADVEQASRFTRYPPVGLRGVGGDRAVRWGLRQREYLEQANEDILLIPLIETSSAVTAIDAILGVAGLHAIYFGPYDLSASYGYLGQWEGPGVADRILDVRSRAAERGIVSGIMATSASDARLRRDQGFKMIGLGSDAGLLIRHTRELLDTLRG
jgi:2-keto-3-deoxy-L-rhamnonate aldolase RhmA